MFVQLKLLPVIVPVADIVQVKVALLSFPSVRTAFLVVVPFVIVENTSDSQFAILVQASVANQAIKPQFLSVWTPSVAPQNDIAPSLSQFAIAAPSSLYKLSNAPLVLQLVAVEVILDNDIWSKSFKVAQLLCINFPVVVSNLAIALSVALAGHTTSPEPLAVLAIVTIPSAPVPVVVRVILLHSTSLILPPVADRVAV